METETLPIDRINKTFQELESQKTLISNCFLSWRNISDHYSSLEKTLIHRSHSLDLKLDLLQSQTLKTLETLKSRESSIPQREISASILISNRRDASIADIENHEYITPRHPIPIVRRFCRQMDAPSLWRFMTARRKDLELIRRDVPAAVAESIDPPRLVIDAVEDFMIDPTAAGDVDSGGERFWAVNLLVKSLIDLMEKKGLEVSRSMRDRAAIVVANWRENYMRNKGFEEEVKGGGVKGGLEGADSRIFLRMVNLFGLSSRIEEDFLLKLVVENAVRKDMAKLANGLGLGAKIEGMELDFMFFF